VTVYCSIYEPTSFRFDVRTGVTVKNTVSKFTSILEEPAAINLG